MGDSLREVMTKELYEAALCGDFEVIENTSDSYLLRKTFVLNNITHIAIRYGNISFVRKVLLRAPHLKWERNLDQDTPLHIAAEMKENADFFTEVCDELTDPSPLRIQNSMGNTVLHVALIHFNLKVARILVKDPELASIINNTKEAPLHLVIKHYPHEEEPDEDMERKTQKLILLMKQKRKHWVEEEDDNIQVKTVKLIYVLLEIASYVAGWRDANGLTPLHKAASLNRAINLDVVAQIIDYCPPSMEVSDNLGKNILHHLVNRIPYVPLGVEFFHFTRIYGLRNRQDNDGNTPLHLAVMYADFIMVQLLFDFKANYLIKNKEGLTPKAMMIQRNMFKMLKTGVMMTEETCRRAEIGDLLSLQHHLKNGGQHFIRSYDCKGQNLLHKFFQIKWGHVIVPMEFLGFVQNVLDSSPQFLEETDKNGDTPVHILARLNPENIMIHLAIELCHNPIYTENLYGESGPKDRAFFTSSYQKYNYAWEVLGKTPFFKHLLECCLPSFVKGCFIKNVNGNTALHEAILANNDLVFENLALLNKQATTLINDSNETVLHLLATHPMNSIEDKVLNDIIINNTQDDRKLLDDDGLSPIMRAIQTGNIQFADKLCSVSPNLARAKDGNGQTFWHLLVNEPPKDSFKSFDFLSSSFQEEVVCNQLETKDKDGKTPLHLAFERRRFDLAQAFIELHGTLKSKGENLFKIQNNDGITPAELLAGLPYVPRQFEEFIGKESTKLGIQSMWGISPTQIKDYVNTMGVIGALLTTITFTAAFTVPGGLDEDTGTPLLMKDIAFQIFIISDIVAMCLSMMVLFCLLWIMATDKKSKIISLLDFSIILLRASFYMTLVTFMAGLYTTTYNSISWVAIFALILCSILLLIMHKCLVKKCMIPCVTAILNVIDGAFSPVRRFCKKIVLKSKIDRQRSSSRSVLPISSNKSSSD